MKEDKFVETTLTDSGAAMPGAGLEVERSKFSMKKYRLVRDSMFNGLEDECEFRISFVLTEKSEPGLHRSAVQHS